MTHVEKSGVAASPRSAPGAPDQVDRLLVIASIALWLAALGAAVAAIVELVGLAGAHPVDQGGSDTPWLLYSVIGISAVVIVGAIPLLVRARRTASSPAATTKPASHGVAGRQSDAPAAAQRLQPFGTPVLRPHATPPASGRVGFPTAAVDQIWLRCTAVIAGAMGAAATGIGVATYLMASGHDTTAWSAYGVAAIFTATIPVAAWYFLRKLHDVIEPPE